MRQKGFTLIELIITIVIIGILAITAAPRFLNFGSDARAATLKGVQGAIASGNNMVYSKMLIANLQNGQACLPEQGAPYSYGTAGCGSGDITTINGYAAPDPTSLRSAFGLIDNEWSVTASGNTIAYISPSGFIPQSGGQCRLVYDLGTGGKPTATIESDGC